MEIQRIIKYLTIDCGTFLFKCMELYFHEKLTHKYICSKLILYQRSNRFRKAQIKFLYS